MIMLAQVLDRCNFKSTVKTANRQQGWTFLRALKPWSKGWGNIMPFHLNFLVRQRVSGAFIQADVNWKSLAT